MLLILFYCCFAWCVCLFVNVLSFSAAWVIFCWLLKEAGEARLYGATSTAFFVPSAALVVVGLVTRFYFLERRGSV